jgi:glycosyltransferase involved in cell wall biosynthesis
MKDKVPLALIYLGRRGGGAKITSQISQELKASKKFELSTICIRSDNELAKVYDQSKVVALFDDLFSARTLFKIAQYVWCPKKLLADTSLGANSYCLIPMISPLGLIVEGLLKKQGVTVIRLLHDFEKHPGDKWPPDILIRYIVNQSKFLIALSNDVAKKIRILNPKIRISIYPHPPFKFSASTEIIETSARYVLFVGRIRKYKGVENLISAFTKLGIEDMELVIAGEGKLRVKKNSGIRIINRWLEEWEITELIKNAEVVIFPYTEASQSGLLPYCLNESKKVVVTPLPGLLEQISNHENVFVTNDFEVKALAVSIDIAIRAEKFSKKSKKFSIKNIEECLSESGLFSKK